ncbi:MAG TPA: trigger factor [Planctomycetaceae bacterium]|nr:trigger factor [Planctomycetaceae bacterium]
MNDEASSGTAVAETGEETPFKISPTVGIEKTGPCRKHVRVSVSRSDLDHYYNDAVKDLVTNAAVPGFRTGHVPRKLIEKRFRKEVGEQVRQKVLMESLERLGEDHKLDAINEPDLDVESLVLPETGDFTYEFDVEVRPEFELPNYSGLSIARPVRTITDADVDAHLEKYLSQFGQLVPYDGAAGSGDFVLANLRFENAGQELDRAENRQIRIRPTLRFADAEIADFDRLMEGVRPGDVRQVVTKISVEASKVELRGEPVAITFEITDVKRLRLPELNAEFFDQVGVDSEAELRQEIRDVLERQRVYQQRQATRRQVLEQITASADWELPESLVKRQVENALRREILEMQQAGFTDEQIRVRQNELLQRQISMTRQALKEHFVLDKIAAQEKLEVTPHDKDVEISYMAAQRGESSRRVRARLEKMNLMDNLDAQILERKAVDVVLEKAVFEDVPGEAERAEGVEAVELSVCGHEVEPAPKSAETGAG